MVTRTLVLGVGLALSALACEPSLNDRTFAVTGPRVLAVQATPAEGAPGTSVALQALYVDPNGAVASGPFDWAFCTARNPLANLGPVSPVCAEPTPASGPNGGTDFVELGTTSSAMGAIPLDACKQFGPDAPSATTGQPPGRPVDPDATGGYYQPVRLTAGGAVTVDLVRVTCDVPGASPAQLTDLSSSDHVNTNPALDSVSANGAALLPDAVGTNPVAPSQRVELRAAWAACDPAMTSCTGSEAYAYLDPQTHTVVHAREQVRVSWFAAGGTFDADRTGRDAIDPTAYTDNAWTAPATPGTARVWVVIRDDRGGVGWQSYVFVVQ